MRRLLLFFLFAVVFQQAHAQKQGVCGTVLWLEGNQMPSPDQKQAPGKGISRRILVYEVVVRDQVEEQEGFYSKIPTRLVASVYSKKNGFYKIQLPPGEYSIFIEEPQGLFASTFDARGAINPVRVEAGKFHKLTITVNYKAAY